MLDTKEYVMSIPGNWDLWNNFHSLHSVEYAKSGMNCENYFNTIILPNYRAVLSWPLRVFKGRIVPPEPHLTFETEEDFLVFKLKYT